MPFYYAVTTIGLKFCYHPAITKISSLMSKLSFSQVATLWKADKRQYVKKASYAIYSHLCNHLILPVFGDIPVPNKETIQSFANSLLERAYAPKTVKDTMLVLKMILHHGEKLGAWPHVEYTVHYPTNVEVPRNIPILAPQDLNKLLRHLRTHFSFQNLGILICLHSGLRIGEVCGLQWKDLDVAAGVIRVNKTVQRINISDGDFREYYVSVDVPKTPSSIREIPLSKELKDIIRPFKKMLSPDFYVISGAGRPLEPRQYRTYFKGVLRQLGIPAIRFHALRHSFATRCIESKCDYKTVSVILGHASISTTLDLYVHPGYAEKKKCIDRMVRTL